MEGNIFLSKGVSQLTMPVKVKVLVALEEQSGGTCQQNI
jgi:hypothetical protein